MRAYLRTGSRTCALKGVTFIGRDAERCAIQIEGPDVSRVHALIVGSDSGFRILDTKSRNGVQVNGTSVESCDLRHLDVIQIGGHRFEFIRSPAPGLEPDRRATEELTLINRLGPDLSRTASTPGAILEVLREGLDASRVSLVRVEAEGVARVVTCAAGAHERLPDGEPLPLEGLDELPAGGVRQHLRLGPARVRHAASVDRDLPDPDSSLAGQVILVGMSDDAASRRVLLVEIDALRAPLDSRAARFLALAADRIGWLLPAGDSA